MKKFLRKLSTDVRWSAVAAEAIREHALKLRESRTRATGETCGITMHEKLGGASSTIRMGLSEAISIALRAVAAEWPSGCQRVAIITAGPAGPAAGGSIVTPTVMTIEEAEVYSSKLVDWMRRHDPGEWSPIDELGITAFGLASAPPPPPA